MLALLMVFATQHYFPPLISFVPVLWY